MSDKANQKIRAGWRRFVRTHATEIQRRLRAIERREGVTGHELEDQAVLLMMEDVVRRYVNDRAPKTGSLIQ
jgi:hypothetical protein